MVRALGDRGAGPRWRRWPPRAPAPSCSATRPTIADICLVPQLYNARRFSVPITPYPTLRRADEIGQRAARLRRGPSRPVARRKPSNEPSRRHQPRHGRDRRRSSAVEIPSLKGKVSDEEWAIRVDLAAAYRLIAYYGWDDLIFTHLSARIPGPEHHFLLNPYNLMFEEVTASLAGQGRHRRQSGRADAVHHQPGRLHHPFGDPHGARGCACGDASAHAAGQAVSAHAEGLLPLTQTAMLVRGDLAFHDYEGVAVDLDERERLVARSRHQERDDPAQPRHAGGRRERRRMLRHASISSSAPARRRSWRCRPATRSTTRRRARRRLAAAAGRGRRSTSPPICSPGRRC